MQTICHMSLGLFEVLFHRDLKWSSMKGYLINALLIDLRIKNNLTLSYFKRIYKQLSNQNL
jgi:hypothetical protein